MNPTNYHGLTCSICSKPVNLIGTKLVREPGIESVEVANVHGHWLNGCYDNCAGSGLPPAVPQRSGGSNE